MKKGRKHSAWEERRKSTRVGEEGTAVSLHVGDCHETIKPNAVTKKKIGMKKKIPSAGKNRRESSTCTNILFGV